MAWLEWLAHLFTLILPAMFGVVGVWIAVLARAEIRARNKEIEKHWHSKDWKAGPK